MEPIPLHHVWSYTDVDRKFWQERLEDWVPRRIFDAHAHLWSAEHRRRPMTDQMRRQHWVNELSEPIDADTFSRCDRIVYPDRQVTRLAFGYPSLEFDLDAADRYAQEQSAKYGWLSLVLLRPQWPVERLAAELDKPGVIGVKPYYSLIGDSPDTRDEYLEAGIFDFLPHAALEVLNERRAWVTLHVPRADRLGHPRNIAEIRELRRRWPDVTVVVAHLGRCYTLPHAREALPQLADDQGLHFDISAVDNVEVLRLALEQFGPRRLLYGTDNPLFFMRGRREFNGRNYVVHTNHPFQFNTRREDPQVETAYTLYMYESMWALRQACEQLGLTRRDVEDIFFGNADRLANRPRS